MATLSQHTYHPPTDQSDQQDQNHFARHHFSAFVAATRRLDNRSQSKWCAALFYVAKAEIDFEFFNLEKPQPIAPRPSRRAIRLKRRIARTVFPFFY